MADFRTIDDFDYKGKRVFLRVDLNVPVKNGKVGDATRIERVVPTIRELMEKGARVVLATHLGRPGGKVDPQYTLFPLVMPLMQALGGKAVAFAPDCVGPEVERAVRTLKDGEVLLLENLRFHPEEEENDEGFAGKLAALADYYVNDAFSAAHRANSSTEAIAHLLPAAAGRLMQAELEALSAALEHPKRPLVALVGGAKVSTKLALLNFMIETVDVLVIGGAMANTLLAAKGLPVGKSLFEADLLGTAQDILDRAAKAGSRLVLPVDAVVAREFKAGAAYEVLPVDGIPGDGMILDIGPASVAAIEAELAKAASLVWNGPLGAFETQPFDQGTIAVARKVAALTEAQGLLSVAGGGDTVAALAAAGVTGKLSYISTAGGAFLEWLEGRELPAVAALSRHARAGS